MLKPQDKENDMDSHVTIIGNMTRDPELRYTPGGTAVANFGVVFNKRRKNDAGRWEDGDPQFFDVTCWNTLAENVDESLDKGTRVVVTGRLEYQQWESDDGAKRSKVIVVADEVGPSLRWATCEVAKVERSDRSQATPAAYDPFEEPF